MLLHSVPTHQATSVTENVVVGAMVHSREFPFKHRFRFWWAEPRCGSGGVVAAGKNLRL